MEALNNKTDLIAAHEKYEVDRTMHRENRERVVKAFREKYSDAASNSVFFFKGDITHSIHDGDTELLPDQEANFWYLFGVEDPDLYGVVEVDTGRSVLFVPELPRELSMWMTIHDKEYFKANYDIDEVFYMSEMEEYFKTRVLGSIYFFYGVDSDSKLTPALPEFEFLSKHKVDKEALYPVLCEVRVIKTKKEIDLMRVIGKVSSDIHILCMRNNKPGIREYQIEALYKFASQSTLGARWLAYPAICASGHGCATLHYNDNDKKFEDGQLTLCDMGLKFYGYCSDITCTYPVNGKFTEKQKQIYNAVLEATNAVKAAVKPGVNWGDMHLLAERTIVKHLINIGIVKNISIEELEEKRVGAIFFPHGLGHFLGLRVHDVGGYLLGCPERIPRLGLRSLRTRRDLQAGMCITVEPGCYFTKYTLDLAKENPEVKDYINWDKVEEYREVGGVRIEDDIIITENGHEDFTQVPRTVEEIELCMSGKEWRKTA